VVFYSPKKIHQSLLIRVHGFSNAAQIMSHEQNASSTLL